MKYDELSAGGRNQRGGSLKGLATHLKRNSERRELPFLLPLYENVSGVALFPLSLPFPTFILKNFKPTKKLKNKYDDNHSLFYLYSPVVNILPHLLYLYLYSGLYIF